MASTAQEEPISAKLMVARDPEDCQRLKEVNKEDATTMVVVMSRKEAPAEKHAPAARANMHPLLAEAACQGNWEEIYFLLYREALQTHSIKIGSQKFHDKLAAYSSGNNRATRISSSATVIQPAPADMEEGIDDAVALQLLKGVTLEGDTVLHLLAANGEGQSFVDCVDLIHGKDKGLLSEVNNKGDTPLHCAARAGKARMVSHLIALAKRDNLVEQLLRKENKRKETALHEAIRIGDEQIIKDLLGNDPELACVRQQDISPMYLAILLKQDNIAQILHDTKSKDKVLSYFGPDGQNALHAAVLRSPVVTKKLLKWNTNKDLTTARDKNGSTPLHFAAGVPGAGRGGGCACSQVFYANTAALYQPDSNGSSPIHVAAALGQKEAVAMFVNGCPSSAGLRDAKGRTFLHVAVENKKAPIVRYACGNPLLSWILNMQDDDGNTALHLAVRAGSILVFGALFGNRKVHLSLTNTQGQTPLDIALLKAPPIMHYSQNSEARIHRALVDANAWMGNSRQDHLRESYHSIHRGYEAKEFDNLKDSTQTLCIGSVLIVTVTFGATFTLPGGYIASDQPNGGAPVLSGRDAFNAFMVANTLAFVCSSIATIGFMFSGSPLVHLSSRSIHLAVSVYFIQTSITALTAAFALGLYMVLAPVSVKTAIAIGVMAPLVVLHSKAEFWLKWALLFTPFLKRMGPVWTIRRHISQFLFHMLDAFWPIAFIIIWVASGKSKHTISVLEAP